MTKECWRTLITDNTHCYHELCVAPPGSLNDWNEMPEQANHAKIRPPLKEASEIVQGRARQAGRQAFAGSGQDSGGSAPHKWPPSPFSPPCDLLPSDDSLAPTSLVHALLPLLLQLPHISLISRAANGECRSPAREMGRHVPCYVTMNIL